MPALQTRERAITVTPADVEKEIVRLFGNPDQTGVVIRVHGAESSLTGRNEAFRELLDSLDMYEYNKPTQRSGNELPRPPGALETEADKDVVVKPPKLGDLIKALSVLGEPRLKRRVFEQILFTFGKHLVEPLGKILDTTPGGMLLSNMTAIRDNLMAWITRLKLTQETQEKLTSDLGAVLTDRYLAELADHEDKVQRPRVAELVKQILRVIGGTFERAFRKWTQHARTIADSVVRRMSSNMVLRESPVVIRDRIIEALEEYLWIETSTELSASVQELFQQPHFRGLVASPPDLKRSSYRQFAEACWDIISENC
ncbi:hypothetical protein [Haliangium ochraceum]|uniref:Uncharacterized protein n=1 Tax=Haliangium ochraceum (strain DSM 14365 / JCM 11303 / SMP-2) TaxID=502025 RepID=D0LYT3_HALO1|nr:hypothetical protein [Haliangium ochraceum]ACY14403.1 conserved hypothetical protein [Haliangium ochraceum DSM 14365]